MHIRQAKSLLIILVLILAPAVAFSASVTLRWQANTEPDISGYNIYYGTSSRNYGTPIPVSNATSHTIDNLTEGRTYYFAVTATDTSGNESGYSSEVSANATSSEPATNPYRLLLSTRSDRSNAVELSGQTIAGDVYIFLDPEAYVSQVVFSIDGKTHNTENYAPYDLGTPFNTSSVSNGAHTISALIRLQDGSSQTISSLCTVENEISTTPPVSSPPTFVWLNTSISSPQSAGTVVRFTATGSGGSGSYEYRFWERGPSTGNKWVAVRDFSTDNSFNWDSTGKVGSTDLGVWVRNAGSDIDQYSASTTAYVYDYQIVEAAAPPSTGPSGVSLSTSTASPQSAGTIVRFTAAGSGGSGSYEYRFWERGPSTGNKWVVVRDFSTNNSYDWDSTGKSGSNDLGVWVRNAGSTIDRYSESTTAYVFGYSIVDGTMSLDVSLSTSTASPQSAGTIVRFTAAGSGGSGSYEYRFWERGPSTGNKWVVVRDFSTNNSYDWDSTGKSGSNDLGVWVRNAGSTIDRYSESTTAYVFGYQIR